MAKRRGLAPHQGDHINVTPLIDIVMCLIIFFMLCGKMVQEDVSQILIPKAKKAQEIEQKNRVIVNLVPTIPPGEEAHAKEAIVKQMLKPKLLIHNKEVAFEDLTATLRKEKEANPDMRLLIRADRDLMYRYISPVIVSCAQADIKSLHFATESEY